MEERSTLIAETVTSENGMPIGLSATANGHSGAGLPRYHAGLVRELPLEDIRVGDLPGEILVRREPLGVVAALVPWNYPQALAMMKIAAGCTVVLNVVPGGIEAGEALVAHPGVDKIAFTGSTATGRTVGSMPDGCCARSPSNSAASPRPSSSTTPTS